MWPVKITFGRKPLKQTLLPDGQTKTQTKTSFPIPLDLVGIAGTTCSF
jgi:hypothetical protein